jgi:anaerobic ribonucleoside-triphosphate reductase activating protein
MRYHNITTDDMLNGDGLRTVLWVSGCAHHCPECQNPITWDPDCGVIFDDDAEKELFAALNKPYISGITFSGGDPLYPANRECVMRLVKKVHELFPKKTIWLYTGYLWEDICGIDGISLVDVIVDGRFEKDLKDVKLHWKGSANQRVIDVRKSVESGRAELYERG